MSSSKLGSVVSGTVLAASVLVHLATFIPGVVIAMEYVWPLHLGAMGAFVLMFVGVFQVQGALRKSAPEGTPAGSHLDVRREFNRRVLAATPLPVKVLFPLVMLYVGYNFFSSMPVGGTPDMRDGVYVLHNRGTVVREITEAEYDHVRTLEVRGFSGHWMLFSLVPLVFFTWVSPQLRAPLREV